jgi:hypothetical protein
MGAVHLMSPARQTSNELIKRRLIFLTSYNTDPENNKFTIETEIGRIICCGIGCNEFASSTIILTAGNRAFNLHVCKICKKKLED